MMMNAHTVTVTSLEMMMAYAFTPPYDDKGVERNDQGGDSDPGFSQLLYDTLSGAKRARFDLSLVYPFNVEDGTKGLYEIRKK